MLFYIKVKNIKREARYINDWEMDESDVYRSGPENLTRPTFTLILCPTKYESGCGPRRRLSPKGLGSFNPWHHLTVLTQSSHLIFPLRYKLAVITAVPTLLTVRAYSNSINERSSCHFLFLFNLSPSVSVLLAYDTTNFYAILLVCRYKILPKMEFHDLWNLA